MADYQLAGEDDNKFTIQHPNGETFEVAKKQLTPDFLEKIKKLPAAQSQEDSSLPNPSSDQMTAFNQAAQSSEPGPSSVQVASPSYAYGEDVNPMPEQSQQPQASATQAPNLIPLDQQVSLKPQQPVQPVTPQQAPLMNQFQQNIGMQEQGIMGAATAQSEAQKAQQKAYEAQMTQMQSIMQKHQQQMQALDQENNKLMTDIAQSKVDPNRYWNNKSAAGKVAASIGLILGGVAQGMRGGDNAAMTVIQNEIQRDVEAQKAELGKKENLLSRNLQKYGNLNAATQATMTQMNAMIQGQIAQAAAKSGSQTALANAQIALGQLRNQSLGQQYQMYQQQVALDMMKNPTGPNAMGADGAMKVRFLVPEARQAEAYKEMQAAQNMSKGRDNLLNAFDQVAEKRTVMNRLMSPIQNERQVEAITGPLTAQLSKDSAGKFTEQDAHMIEKFWPSYGDNEDTLALKKRQLNKFITEKMNFPLLDAYGIHPNSNTAYNSMGQKTIQESAPKV